MPKVICTILYEEYTFRFVHDENFLIKIESQDGVDLMDHPRWMDFPAYLEKDKIKILSAAILSFLTEFDGKRKVIYSNTNGRVVFIPTATLAVEGVDRLDAMRQPVYLPCNNEDNGFIIDQLEWCLVDLWEKKEDELNKQAKNAKDAEEYFNRILKGGSAAKW